MKKSYLASLLGLFVLSLSSCTFTFGPQKTSTSEEPIPSESSTSSEPEEDTTSSEDGEKETSSSSTSTGGETQTSSSTGEGDKIIWQDEFDGNALNPAYWTCETGTRGDGWGNNEQQYYRAENATVGGGYLTITAKREDYGGMRYTSARIKTQGKAFFTYGRIEARMRLPGITGSWPAFWMLPENLYQGRGWPWNGEIDIMENRGNQPYEYLSTLHTGNENQSDWWSCQFSSGDHRLSSSVTDWHVYGVDWQEDHISFYVDGVTFFTVYSYQWQTWSAYGGSAAPFNQDFFILFNLAIGGNFIGGQLPNDANLPCQMQVDYVRVYEN